MVYLVRWRLVVESALLVDVSHVVVAFQNAGPLHVSSCMKNDLIVLVILRPFSAKSQPGNLQKVSRSSCIPSGQCCRRALCCVKCCLPTLVSRNFSAQAPHSRDLSTRSACTSVSRSWLRPRLSICWLCLSIHFLSSQAFPKETRRVVPPESNLRR